MQEYKTLAKEMSYTTITIDNRDLAYTIDTYNMFTAEHVFDSETEHIANEYGIDATDIDFDFDHKGYVQALAGASVQLLHENFAQHGNGIVRDITLKSSTSPQFYNYTTDNYVAEWDINTDKLTKYIDDNLEAFIAYKNENWDYEYSKALEDDDAETLVVIRLDYYTRNEYDLEDYEQAMFENESEAYEYITPDEATQKLIDQAIKETE